MSRTMSRILVAAAVVAVLGAASLIVAKSGSGFTDTPVGMFH
jgi:hypothetical protein